MAVANSDVEIYRAGNVTVSQALVKIGGASYPINSIGSVFIRGPKRAGLIIAFFVFALATLIFTAGGSVGGIVCGILALLFLMAAIGAPSTLVFRNASGDQPALTDRSQKRLQEVKSAIEQAVVLRG